MEESDTEEPELHAAIIGMRGATAWQTFELGLRSENRHFVADSEYFSVLIARCRALATIIPRGETLYRARLLSPDQQRRTTPLKPFDHGAPPPELASAGRLNPEGIPYLYLASDPATAVAEIRPWVRARVSVGWFRTIHDLHVVDLRPEAVQDLEPDDPAVWASFMLRFPAHRSDPLAYVATQFLAEKLKSEGLDGPVYSTAVR